MLLAIEIFMYMCFAWLVFLLIKTIVSTIKEARKRNVNLDQLITDNACCWLDNATERVESYRSAKEKNEVEESVGKEKAFEYDKEFREKLQALRIRVSFYTIKRMEAELIRGEDDELEISASWGFYTVREARLEEFARLNVKEDGAHAYLDKNRNVFDILGFQAAIEVLTLITDKEKQLNEILKEAEE